MPGEMSRISPVSWKSDQQQVVLEVPDGKSARDSEKCTIRELLRELEDSGFTDPSINCHDIVAPLAAEVGEGLGSTNQLTQESRNQCLVPVVILHVEVVSSPTWSSLSLPLCTLGTTKSLPTSSTWTVLLPSQLQCLGSIAISSALNHAMYWASKTLLRSWRPAKHCWRRGELPITKRATILG